MKDNKIKSSAIVLAGGRGSRMESDIPKQYINVCGYPLIYYSLKVFEDSFVDEIVLVCGSGDEEYCRKEIVEKYDFKKVKHITAGGKERFNSVYNGLCAIGGCDIVFIHDGARPFINETMLKRVLDETIKHHATVAAVASKDTVKIADAEGFAASTPNRSSVYIMQTPQTFDYKEIKEAYDMLLENEQRLKDEGIAITDDAMVMEQFGTRRVKFVEGDYKNIKITTPEDILIAEAFLNERK